MIEHPISAKWLFNSFYCRLKPELFNITDALPPIKVATSYSSSPPYVLPTGLLKLAPIFPQLGVTLITSGVTW